MGGDGIARFMGQKPLAVTGGGEDSSIVPWPQSQPARSLLRRRNDRSVAKTAGLRKPVARRCRRDRHGRRLLSAPARRQERHDSAPRHRAKAPRQTVAVPGTRRLAPCRGRGFSRDLRPARERLQRPRGEAASGLGLRCRTDRRSCAPASMRSRCGHRADLKQAAARPPPQGALTRARAARRVRCPRQVFYRAG